jgi:hypothetical protein
MLVLAAWEGRLEEQGQALKDQEQALQEQETARLQRHKEREAEFARNIKEHEAALSKEQGALNKRDNQQKEEDQRLKVEATRLQVGPTTPQHSDGDVYYSPVIGKGRRCRVRIHTRCKASYVRRLCCPGCGHMCSADACMPQNQATAPC